MAGRRLFVPALAAGLTVISGATLVTVAYSTGMIGPSRPDRTDAVRFGSTGAGTGALPPRTPAVPSAEFAPIPPATTPPATTPPASRRSATSPRPSPAVPPRPVPGRALGIGRLQFGPSYPGEGTFYGATGAGSCLFEAGGDLMVAAMNKTDYGNSQACGAFVQVTGPKGTVTVKIVDHCPECRPGAIDLSRQAFAKIANPIDGRVRLSWRLVSPGLSGSLAYRYKEGSSQWWCGLQVRNHRNPVRSVEARINGTWKPLARQEYNYFLSVDGSGCGKALRVTDIYDHRITQAPLPIRAGAVQQGSGQFGPPD